MWLSLFCNTDIGYFKMFCKLITICVLERIKLVSSEQVEGVPKL